MQFIYVANVLVAGLISLVSLFDPATAITTVYQGTYRVTEVVRLVGCLWLSIAVLSFFGLFKPIPFSAVLLVQLIYKSVWLLAVAVPAIITREPYPRSMALFFLVWVIVLPFVIPWSYFFNFSSAWS